MQSNDFHRCRDFFCLKVIKRCWLSLSSGNHNHSEQALNKKSQHIDHLIYHCELLCKKYSKDANTRTYTLA